MRQHHLHHVPGAGVLTDSLNALHEPFASEPGSEVALLHGLVGRAGMDLGPVRQQPGGARLEFFTGGGEGVRLIGFGQRHQLHAPGDVVEDDDVRGKHEQDVWRVQVVGRCATGEALLDVADGVVAEVAHETPEEAGQVREVRHAEAAAVVLDPGERIVGFGAFRHAAAVGDRELIAVDPQDGVGGQPDDRIPPPLLAPLCGGFEQVGERPRRQLHIGGKRRVEVRQRLVDDGDVRVPLRGKAVEVLLVHGRCSRGKS